MSNVKKQEQKKKNREKEVKKKILRRKTAIRRLRKEESKKEDSLECEYYKKKKDDNMTADERMTMLENITGKAVAKLTDQERTDRDAAIVARLKNNIKLLEELERQYEEEQASREKVNRTLEVHGATTIHEKIDLISQIER